MISVLYFAWVRVQVGRSSEEVETKATTVAQLIEELKQRSAGHAAALAQVDKLRVSVNQAMADTSSPIAPGDEVAIFPPMTGG